MKDEIFYNKDGVWEKQSFFNKIEKFNKKVHKSFFYKLLNNGFEISDKREKDNLKWAWVKVGNTRKMCWVDSITNKAYKADGYNKTNIEIKNFTFERWCTSFDL